MKPAASIQSLLKTNTLIMPSSMIFDINDLPDLETDKGHTFTLISLHLLAAVFISGVPVTHPTLSHFSLASDRKTNYSWYFHFISNLHIQGCTTTANLHFCESLMWLSIIVNI